MVPLAQLLSIPLQDGVRFFLRPLPASLSAGLTAHCPWWERDGLTTFRTSPMDAGGCACPPVAPQLRAVLREHCHWPRTFWCKPASPFGLLACHDVYQRFT